MMEVVSCGNVTDKGIIALHKLRSVFIVCSKGNKFKVLLVLMVLFKKNNLITNEVIRRCFLSGNWSICFSVIFPESKTDRQQLTGCKLHFHIWKYSWTWTDRVNGTQHNIHYSQVLRVFCREKVCRNHSQSCHFVSPTKSQMKSLVTLVHCDIYSK